MGWHTLRAIWPNGATMPRKLLSKSNVDLVIWNPCSQDKAREEKLENGIEKITLR